VEERNGDEVDEEVRPVGMPFGVDVEREHTSKLGAAIGRALERTGYDRNDRRSSDGVVPNVRRKVRVM
jgi:hypothetical protein